MTEEETIRAALYEKFKDVKLFIATPAYGGQCRAEYTGSIFSLAMLLGNIGVQCEQAFIPNISIISKARNMLVDMFMDSGCTHMLFIDADIGFHAPDVLRMIAADVDLVAAACPRKEYDFKNLVGKTPKSVEEAKELLATTNFKPVTNEKGQAKMVNGLFEVERVGTGFMMLRRQVIEKMIQAYPETRVQNTIPTKKGDFFHALFDFAIIDESYWGEDYLFCKRWREIGGKVWLDNDIITTHSGMHTFEGIKPFKAI